MAKALTTTEVRHSPYCVFEPIRLTMRTHSVQNPMKKRAAKQIFPTMVSLMIPTLPMLILMVVNSVLNLKLDVVLDAILLTISIVFYESYSEFF